MTGDDTDGTLGCFNDKSANGCVGAKGFQRPENNGMVGDYAVVPAVSGQVNQRAGRIQCDEDSVQVLPGFTDEKADIIPVFSEVIGSYLLKNIEKIANCWHGWVMLQIKRGTSLVDVPLFGHCVLCPAGVSALLADTC